MIFGATKKAADKIIVKRRAVFSPPFVKEGMGEILKNPPQTSFFKGGSEFLYLSFGANAC